MRRIGRRWSAAISELRSRYAPPCALAALLSAKQAANASASLWGLLHTLAKANAVMKSRPHVSGRGAATLEKLEHPVELRTPRLTTAVSLASALRVTQMPLT
mmetsp:Transcript_28788/g.72343  ORF Transcript_28788/g.72343 Transcript_28788/m.72343 type:complete len:102 (+) Transcript_28788:102-407(+)